MNFFLARMEELRNDASRNNEIVVLLLWDGGRNYWKSKDRILDRGIGSFFFERV